eukprot:gene4757-6486_t
MDPGDQDRQVAQPHLHRCRHPVAVQRLLVTALLSEQPAAQAHVDDVGDGVLTYRASSLFSEENIARLFMEMPKTFAGFAPLGLVLTIMMGAAVAERAGLFSALIRASLRNASKGLLTPIVAIIGMVSHHASDAAYVVFIPLAAIIFAVAGRHPLAGLAAAFAARRKAAARSRRWLVRLGLVMARDSGLGGMARTQASRAPT